MKFKFFVLVWSMFILLGCTPKTVEVVTQPVAGTPAQPQTGPKTLFYDNFDTRKNEWQQVRGIWKLDDKGFFLQCSADPRHINSIVYVDYPQAADGTIETFVRINPDLPAVLTDSPQDRELLRSVRYIAGAGIIFRYKDQDNFYMFRLAGEEGAVLGKMVDGVWVDLVNPRSADFLPERVKFSGSNWYRLKVEAYGSQLVCSIDDSVVATKTDTTFDLGRFGLCTFQAKADFDYIKVVDKTESESKQ
jgi:hypothetical protein